MYYKYQIIIKAIILSLLVALMLAVNYAFANDNQNRLSLHDAVAEATQRDPWLQGNLHEQRSLEHLSQAARSLPAPKISIGQSNISVDSLSFNQDPMSQFKLGVSQVFPRGDSLTIKHRQLKTQSLQYPYWQQDRKAKIKVIVGSLWLDLFLLRQTVNLIEKNQRLFEQLLEITQSRYASTIGIARQNNIVRTELELTRIKDKLLALKQKRHHLLGELRQWLPQQSELALTDNLPVIRLAPTDQIVHNDQLTDEEIISHFYRHPAVAALDKKITASTIGIELAKQKYKPQWSINASYGHRDNRDDLLSLGVTLDLPVFTANSNDQQVRATIAQTEAVKTEKQLLLKQLLGDFLSVRGRLKQLVQRQALHDGKLLEQFHQQTAVALNAYTNDIGDFSEVVRAQIAELNAEIDQLTLKVKQQKLHLEMNYLFARASEQDSAILTTY